MNSDSNAAEQQGKTSNCRPFVKWVGGKGQLLNILIENLPTDMATYYEPFLGGGALFFALQPKLAVLSDINSDLIEAFSCVQQFPEELISDLSAHKYDEDYFYSLRNIDRTPYFTSLSPVQRTSRLIYLNKACYNGLYRVNSKGQFNTPFGRYSNPTICDSENLRSCSVALKNTSLLCDTFKESTHTARAGDFIYLDPPYLPINATSNFTGYVAGGFSLADQEELAEYCSELNSRNIKFLLSNSDTETTRALYKNFNISSVKALRAVNSKAAKRGPVSELLVKNY